LNRKTIETLTTSLLQEIEGDQLRKDLVNTPFRVYKSMIEIYDGYNVDIKSLFTVSEGEGDDQILALRDIHSWSMCQHHMLPFFLTAHIAYLPDGKVIGISKIERLVHAFSHRLQLQERITRQIADAIMEYLNPKGVAVILQGEHLCMKCRGVKSQETKFVSSIMLGAFRENYSSRMEVMSLLGLNS
jgi:GTP cyclohydrolase I